jgi:hypothetical protein
MAHFAELDENSVVLRVLVVNNDELESDNEEASGIVFLNNLLGEELSWKQTSYNGNFRKNYAGIGFAYDVARDAFIPIKPTEGNWVLNEETCRWDEVSQ